MQLTANGSTWAEQLVCLFIFIVSLKYVNHEFKLHLLGFSFLFRFVSRLLSSSTPMFMIWENIRSHNKHIVQISNGMSMYIICVEFEFITMERKKVKNIYLLFQYIVILILLWDTFPCVLWEDVWRAGISSCI